MVGPLSIHPEETLECFEKSRTVRLQLTPDDIHDRERVFASNGGEKDLGGSFEEAISLAEPLASFNFATVGADRNRPLLLVYGKIVDERFAGLPRLESLGKVAENSRYFGGGVRFQSQYSSPARPGDEGTPQSRSL